MNCQISDPHTAAIGFKMSEDHQDPAVSLELALRSG